MSKSEYQEGWMMKKIFIANTFILLTGICSASEPGLPQIINFRRVFVFKDKQSTPNGLLTILDVALMFPAQELNNIWETLPEIKSRKELKSQLNFLFADMHKSVKLHDPKKENELYVKETATRLFFYDSWKLLSQGMSTKFLADIFAKTHEE